MVDAVRPVDATLRLVEQLNALSQLTETLAFRLVELEERLAASEQLLQPLLEAGMTAPQAEATELRLEDTEERIARLESLLNGAGASGQARGWSPLPTGLSREPEPLDDPDPFLEEGEQPFMDELAIEELTLDAMAA